MSDECPDGFGDFLQYSIGISLKNHWGVPGEPSGNSLGIRKSESLKKTYRDFI